MTKQQIINTILNERGYIYRENENATPELYDRNGELLQRVPLATMRNIAALPHIETWNKKYYGEYVAHYLCKEYTQHENEQHCKRIADDLSEYADGNIYKCPECGETHNITSEKYRCSCGFVGDIDEYEQQSMYDYLIENGLDIEYRIGADKEYRSCEIMVAWGGPNIYIDTAENVVKLFWGGERAQYYICSSVSDEINDACEEQYNCL